MISLSSIDLNSYLQGLLKKLLKLVKCLASSVIGSLCQHCFPREKGKKVDSFHKFVMGILRSGHSPLIY